VLNIKGYHMKAKKKPRGIKQKIREEKKKEQHILSSVFIAVILIATISISGFLVNSMLNQPITSTSEPKAAIVDHLSLTASNQTFIQAATDTLRQAGYSVDYFPGDQVKVEFYRNLPARGYKIVILRGHSATGASVGKPSELDLFTSEPYNTQDYLLEQLHDQVVRVAFSMDGPSYFAVTQDFIRSCTRGRFCDTIVIMMGCNGLTNSSMAEAFVQKGAKIYIGWSDFVPASHTDLATTHLLRHLISEKQTIKQAVDNTNEEVGSDPGHNTQLVFYPPEAGDQIVENISGN
jgi:hypothetical protein